MVSWQNQAQARALARLQQRTPHNPEVALLGFLARRAQAAHDWKAPPDDDELCVNAGYALAAIGSAPGVAAAAQAVGDRETWRLDHDLLAFIGDPQPAEHKEPLLLATNIGRLPSPEADARQAAAMDHLDRIAAQDGALVLLNAADADELTRRPGWVERALPRSAREVVDPGCRKIPIARDIFQAAADEARARGIRYFGYLNSDILLSPQALFSCRSLINAGYETLGFTRTDIGRADDWCTADAWLGLHFSGTDMFVWSVAWWDRYGHLFEPYVLGAYWWDNVYMGIMMMHSRCYYASQQRGAIFHVVHQTISAHASTQARFNLDLRENTDSFYFQVQDHYCHKLREFIKQQRGLPNMRRNLALFDDKFLRELRKLKAGETP